MPNISREPIAYEFHIRMRFLTRKISSDYIIHCASIMLLHPLVYWEQLQDDSAGDHRNGSLCAYAIQFPAILYKTSHVDALDFIGVPQFSTTSYFYIYSFDRRENDHYWNDIWRAEVLLAANAVLNADLTWCRLWVLRKSLLLDTTNTFDCCAHNRDANLLCSHCYSLHF